jgi:cytochrome c biogenesis protein CcdA
VLAVLLLVASIALVDSLNPTTVGPALVLATGKHPARALAGFTLGVFAVSFAGGLLLTFGPGEFLLSLVPHPGHDARSIVELGGGALLVAIGAGLIFHGARIAERSRARRPGGRSALVLGAGIMALELPTALPYFAAIAAIVGSGLAWPQRLLLVLAFNLVFIAPLVAILALRLMAGAGATRVLDRIGKWLTRRAPLLLGGFLVVCGLVLIVLGVVGLTTA